jgi:sulfide:quinone oxidoreductase
MMKVLVLGAGFGGLELTTRLSDELGDAVEIVLIDKAEEFVFGFSRLDVMFGRTATDAVVHPYRDLIKPGVRFVRTTIRSVNPGQRRVETDAGNFDADVMVVALGADLDPAATPGLVEGGHEFYSMPGAIAVRDVLAAFDGGRVVIGVTSTPFKCPPAPSEAALLMHDYLTDRGSRDRSEISLVTPLGAPIPPSPDASEALLGAFAQRGIRLYPSQLVRELDTARKVARLADGGEIPYDLFLGVPVHKAPAVVQASGLCVGGWIPVDPRTLETAFPGVYAIGDVTSVGTPKAGVFAEGQAAVVAAAIIARQAGDKSRVQYDGRGRVYMEFGHHQVARLDLTFAAGRPPTGTFEAPSTDLTGHKSEFVATRVQRWLGRDIRHHEDVCHEKADQR